MGSSDDVRSKDVPPIQQFLSTKYNFGTCPPELFGEIRYLVGATTNCAGIGQKRIRFERGGISDENEGGGKICVQLGVPTPVTVGGRVAFVVR